MKKSQESEVIDLPKNGMVKTQESDSDKFIELAIKGNAPIETLKELFAMKKEYDAIEARKKFFAALSGFQSEMGTVGKDKSVSFGAGKTSYKYATLDSIIEQARPLLNKYGLSYQFKATESNGRITVTCVLIHTDGHSEETSFSGAPDESGSKNKIQGSGSAATYLQRYTFTMALGIATGNDTDGNVLNTEENWESKIKSFKDYDSLVNYCNGHALKNDPSFRDAASKQIKVIQGGN